MILLQEHLWQICINSTKETDRLVTSWLHVYYIIQTYNYAALNTKVNLG